MADRRSIKSTKVAKNAAASQVAAKAAKPRKSVAKSSARKPTNAAAKELPAHYAVPKATATKSKGPAVAAKPTLLSGGNPQIAKGYGDAPVQAYIAAMPGWKSDVGRRLDALIERTVPGVRKAVKWNSPLYGVEDNVWFLGIHVFAKYIKVAFFRGASLRPLPPGRVQAKGGALLPHPRGRPARRSAVRRLGQASERIARRTHVTFGSPPFERALQPRREFLSAKLNGEGEMLRFDILSVRRLVRQACPSCRAMS